MSKLFVLIFSIMMIAGCDTAITLSDAERAELDGFINSGDVFHEINSNTTLLVVLDDFGENILGCGINIKADGPNGVGFSHNRWDLRIFIDKHGAGNESAIFANQMHGEGGGEIRLIINGEKYAMSKRRGERRLGVLSPAIIKSLLSADSAQALHGQFMGKMFELTYDVRGFKKAYRFASTICS